MHSYEELVKIAQQVRTNAYVPYFGFHVGAALLTDDDCIYTGVNIEGASFGVTVCAERTAFYKAVSEGVRSFKAIAVASDSEEYIYPCGICRQVMSDFVKDDFIVICSRGDGQYQVKTFAQLLPNARIPI